MMAAIIIWFDFLLNQNEECITFNQVKELIPLLDGLCKVLEINYYRFFFFWKVYTGLYYHQQSMIRKWLGGHDVKLYDSSIWCH